MSRIGQEEGQTLVETLSTADLGLKMIGASCSKNTSNKSSIWEREKDGADKPVHDEVDNTIVSH